MKDFDPSSDDITIFLPPKSSRAVEKALEKFGFDKVELWHRQDDHWVYSSQHDVWSLSAETIPSYGLRLKDQSLGDWLYDFYSLCLESDFDKDYCYGAKWVNEPFKKLKEYLVSKNFVSNND